MNLAAIKYTLTKIWKKDEPLNVHHTQTQIEVPLPTTILTTEPLSQGKYVKSLDGFTLGVEEGHTFWSPNVVLGRVEYRGIPYDKDHIQLYMGFGVVFDIQTYTQEDGKVQYMKDGLSFDTLEDLVSYIYLHNEHDFSEKDLVYQFGRRKYSNILVKLD